MQAGSAGDTVGHETSEDLCPAVEAEPDADPGALFFLRIPLPSVSTLIARKSCEDEPGK